MRVLSVTSEIAPLAKTGGLADVAGALPTALAALGVETVSLVPGYPAVKARLKKKKALVEHAEFFGGPAAILSGKAGGHDLFVLDAPHLFDRPGGLYGDVGGDWPDNWRRFAALSRAGADIAEAGIGGWQPDLVHVHDWQAALVPAYLRYGPRPDMPSVITVHNLAFQGQFPPWIFGELGLPPEAMSMDGVEYYGGVGYLKAGLQAAGAITTVSPTYARQIRRPAFGMGLDGLLRSRAEDVHGILNGIDTETWDPGTDPHLAERYGPGRLKARATNRASVADRFGITADDGPLVCVVSRLTWQKGIDLLVDAVEGIVAGGARLVVLGTGDQGLEGALLAAAARHRGRLGVVIGYDEPLAHLMQGGADAILIPSRFEPCGLTQLYGLRYGCVPVVARTGGLADTVIDANEAALAAGVATGLLFAPDDPGALLEAVERLAELHARPGLWRSLQKQGMKADVSWRRSARRYLELYQHLLAKRQPA